MKRLITFFIIIFCLVFIFNTVRSIVTLWQRGNFVTDQEGLLAQKRQENEELKQKLMEVESLEFIEKQARDKLNLQKEGEVVVILPKSQNSELNDQKEEVTSVSNWQKWWELIF